MTRIPQPARDAPAAEWAVYADALLEAGDPRGELIALADKPAERDAHVERHKDALFGKAKHFSRAFRVTWHQCIADEVAIRVAQTEQASPIVKAFLASPLAEARTIALVGAGRVSLGGAIQALIAGLPASTRVLRLVDERAAETRVLSSRDYQPDENLVDFGDLSRVWGAPQLEEVTLDVADTHQLDLGTLDAPHLQRFALRGLRLAPLYRDLPLVQSLCGAWLPELRSFELRLVEQFVANIVADRDAYIPHYIGADETAYRMSEADLGGRWGDGDWDALRPLFTMLSMCPLERLALTSFDDGDAVLALLAEVGLAPTLHTLDLSDGRVTSVDWFLANRAMLFGLKRLVLERTALPKSDAKRLHGLGPEIVWSAGDAPGYRYVVGQE